MTDENDKVYRATVFLNSGFRITFNSKDKMHAVQVKTRFKTECLRDNTPFEISNLGDQRIVFNPMNIGCVLLEGLVPGQEGYDDPLERFIYH